MEAILLARSPFCPQRGLSRGVITKGWALLTYGGKPIGLLGRGDLLRGALEPPIDVVPIGPLGVEDDGGRPGFDQKGVLQQVCRHTARLSLPALSRTADLLIDLAEKIDRGGKDVLEIDLPLSQIQLADLLGLSVVHMNRTMMQLKTRNLVRYGKGLLTILDRPRLARLCATIHD